MRPIGNRASVATKILDMRRRGLAWKIVMRRTGYGRERCRQLHNEALAAETAETRRARRRERERQRRVGSRREEGRG